MPWPKSIALKDVFEDKCVWCSNYKRLFGQILHEYGEIHQPFTQALSSPFSMNKYLGASGRKGNTIIWTTEKNVGTQRTTCHSSSRPRISLTKKETKKTPKWSVVLQLSLKVFHCRKLYLYSHFVSSFGTILKALKNPLLLICLPLAKSIADSVQVQCTLSSLILWNYVSSRAYWQLNSYVSPKNCPDSLPSDVKVAEVRVTMPLIFLGEISPRYIKWVLSPKPAGYEKILISKNVTCLCTVCYVCHRIGLTCWVSIQDPCHNNHFIWFGTFTCQHDPCCNNANKAVADHHLFPDEGTHIKSF